MALACPACGAASYEPFYDGGSVPAHSCLLMESPAQARAYPRGELRLAFCDGCGFVGNDRHDAALVDYSPRYEETQHCSAHFHAWAQGLVRRLVRDYGLRHKTVLEIGCGKGEFLALLCEEGGNRGIGVDPSVVPERLPAAARRRIELIPELYGPAHAALRADVVCCRHTLEHIPSVREFLAGLRATLGDGGARLVFFEVPDLRRVLRERAFWDVYYEHCSYFDAGSFARLFRACGFEILELVRDFDGQYLWLVARPVEGRGRGRHAEEVTVADLRREVEGFGEEAPRAIARWRERIRRAAETGGRPVLWGAGSKCVAFVASTGLSDEIGCVVDINPVKQGRHLPGSGHAVVAPEALRGREPGCVVLMNPVYRTEVEARLAALGLDTEVVAL